MNFGALYQLFVQNYQVRQLDSPHLHRLNLEIGRPPVWESVDDPDGDDYGGCGASSAPCIRMQYRFERIGLRRPHTAVLAQHSRAGTRGGGASDQDNKEATGIYAREMTKRERGGC